jgi:hypothetical protein
LAKSANIRNDFRKKEVECIGLARQPILAMTLERREWIAVSWKGFPTLAIININGHKKTSGDYYWSNFIAHLEPVSNRLGDC